LDLNYEIRFGSIVTIGSETTLAYLNPYNNVILILSQWQQQLVYIIWHYYRDYKTHVRRRRCALFPFWRCAYTPCGGIHNMYRYTIIYIYIDWWIVSGFPLYQSITHEFPDSSRPARCVLKAGHTDDALLCLDRATTTALYSGFISSMLMSCA